MKRWHFKDCVKILCHNNKQYEYKLVCGKSTPLPKATASKRKGKNAPKEAKSNYVQGDPLLLITALFSNKSCIRSILRLRLRPQQVEEI